jgi:hypothetical protein
MKFKLEPGTRGGWGRQFLASSAPVSCPPAKESRSARRQHSSRRRGCGSPCGRRLSGILVALVASLVCGEGWAQAGLESCIQSDVIFFSTEVTFLTKGPVPPDGNPIISGGDLLGRKKQMVETIVCLRNAQLLAPFETTVDLGLDAIDIIHDGEERIAIFSTELDSPQQDSFRAGDLLATNGAVIPNQVLLQNFSIGFDVGLDAVHAIGEPRALLGFWSEAAQFERGEWLNDPEALLALLEAYDVDFWVSTEGNAPTPSTPGLVGGDLLSVRTGQPIATNGQLLPSDVPAGIPLRGVDFGLDAVSTDRAGSLDLVHFSTEIPFTGPPAFGDSDLLGWQLGWMLSGADLVVALEPGSQQLGLDAVAVPEPSAGASLAAGLGLLATRMTWLGRRGGGGRVGSPSRSGRARFGLR